jgi:hypothetical protein
VVSKVQIQTHATTLVKELAVIALITQLALCFYNTGDTVYRNKQILSNKINLVLVLGSYKKNKLVMTYISKLLRVWIRPSSTYTFY